MEAHTRLLQKQEVGTLLLDRNRCPYITGCVLPSMALTTSGRIPAQLDAKIQLSRGQLALELTLHLEGRDGEHLLHWVLPYAVQREFLLELGESSALYLLTGSEHPRRHPADKHVRTLYQRIHDGGLAVEVGEAVRGQIALLEKLYQALPGRSEMAWVSGC
jgi:hypothetical protein